MKITRTKAYAESLSLKRPYTIAYKTVSEVTLVFFEIHTDTKRGIGAANPSAFVVGESSDQVLEALKEETSFLIGKDCRQLPALLRQAEQEFSQRPGTLAALDIALHDLFGQVMDLSIVDYLGSYHQSLPTSITIGIKSLKATLEEAREYLDAGFKCLKVKLGHSVDEDLERLHRLRESYGYGINIRVDANQGYTYEDVMYFHEETEALRIELVEQPLPARALVELRQLPGELRDYLAADESLVTPEDAFRLACSPRACGIFNLKLMKSGGIARAMRMAEIARLGNIDLMWGCNDESAVSITAALHAAFANPNTRYLDLDGSFDLAYDLVKGGFDLREGMLSMRGGPGLGVEW